MTPERRCQIESVAGELSTQSMGTADLAGMIDELLDEIDSLAAVESGALQYVRDLTLGYNHRDSITALMDALHRRWPEAIGPKITT